MSVPSPARWNWKTIPGTEGKLVSERLGAWDPRAKASVCKLWWRRGGATGAGAVFLGTASRDAPNEPYFVRRKDGSGPPATCRTLKEAGYMLAVERGLLDGVE